jgi:hypothetical protein
MDRDARFARCRACIIVEKRADVRAGLLAPQTYDKRIAHDRAIPRLGEESEWMDFLDCASTAGWL